MAWIQIAILSVPIVWWRKPCEGLYGHGTSPWGDVREVPTTERSFLAGETESVFVITNWDTRTSFLTILIMRIQSEKNLRFYEGCL